MVHAGITLVHDIEYPDTRDRKWIDIESYLLIPTALGLFLIGTCGAIGTDNLLACFVAGNALNWDAQFPAETERPMMRSIRALACYSTLMTSYTSALFCPDPSGMTLMATVYSMAV